MNRPIRRALTVVAVISGLALTGLTASGCAAKPTVPKRHVITFPAPDQVSDVYHADQCPWLNLVQDSEAPIYSMLISSPLCAGENSKAGN